MSPAIFPRIGCATWGDESGDAEAFTAGVELAISEDRVVVAKESEVRALEGATLKKKSGMSGEKLEFAIAVRCFDFFSLPDRLTLPGLWRNQKSTESMQGLKMVDLIRAVRALPILWFLGNHYGKWESGDASDLKFRIGIEPGESESRGIGFPEWIFPAEVDLAVGGEHLTECEKGTRVEMSGSGSTRDGEIGGNVIDLEERLRLRGMG